MHSSPPRALRVATLRDRIVLHDTTAALRGGDPSARNALIDAANAADSLRRSAAAYSDASSARSPLIDVSSPAPARTPSPNAAHRPPHVADSTTHAGSSGAPSARARHIAGAREETPAGSKASSAVARRNSIPPAQPVDDLSTRSSSGGLAGFGFNNTSGSGSSARGGRTPRTADKYLIIPFPTRTPSGIVCRDPYETYDAAEAGIDDPDSHIAPVDAAAGYLGLLRLHSAAYCVLVSQIRRSGALPTGPVMCVMKVRMLKLGVGQPSKEDRDFASAISKLLEGGALYYALDFDLTRSLDKGSEGADSATRSPGAARSRVGNAFWWTWPMARLGGPTASSWALQTVYGFVGSQSMRFSSEALQTGSGHFVMTLISRRSRRRAGTRFITRGADALGDVANFVETEQIVWSSIRPNVYSAFTVIRGSVPVFWRQNNGIARPSPELDGTLADSRAAFSAHFRNMVRSYGGVVAVSLVDLHGSEAVLADAFERHFDLDIASSFKGSLAPRLLSFDFHTQCGGKEYERGLASLMERLRADVEDLGFFTHGVTAPNAPKTQRGVFRVNCVDCLDRTNVVQSMVSREVLAKQVASVFQAEMGGNHQDLGKKVHLRLESEDRFKHIWGDNADAISKQYSGTGALKTDFTRTGKRSTTGIMGDGVKSVVRMYYKNFVDEGRQEAIDILCGNASVRPRAAHGPNDALVANNGSTITSSWNESESGAIGSAGGGLGRRASGGVAAGMDVGGIPDMGVDRSTVNGLIAKESALWYSFSALRMNGGGDRQAVVIELRDDMMQLATPEGVNFEYPRRGLAAWDKCEDSRGGDRRPSRLRFVHHPASGSPAAASPLDLLFRTGPTARENFLRAYLSWAQPGVVDTIGGPVRIRVRSARGVSRHRMSDWGLGMSDSGSAFPGEGDSVDGDAVSPEECQGREIVALVVPEGHSETREWGLAAVPLDVDRSNFVLVCARAVSSRGPAIAILASKEAAPSVMSINETVVGRAGSLTGGGAVGVSLVVSGASLCFVSARVGGPKDLFRIISTLKLRRPMFDVTNQFEHVYVAGVMGDLQWRTGDVPPNGPGARRFLRLGDGSQAYALGCGLSVMRNSFPTLDTKNLLSASSFWLQRRRTSLDHDGGGDERRRQGDGPALCVSLIDEVVPGSGVPVFPSDPRRCVVILSNLRGEGIKMPPGIDQSTPLNTFFAIYSDYVGYEGLTTRATSRPTDQPEWREPIRLAMIPSDVSEVQRSFLLGQVLIPTPLSDPIPAGHCVIPVSYAKERNGSFDVPLRLAGIATGRIQGTIEFEVLPADETGSAVLRDEQEAAEFGHPGPSESSRVEESSSRLTPVGVGLSRLESGLGNFAPAAFHQRPSIDEVNEKFDIARRKGSRQIKSMVGKLSSFLNNQTVASTTGMPQQGTGDSTRTQSGSSNGQRSTDQPGSGDDSLPRRFVSRGDEGLELDPPREPRTAPEALKHDLLDGLRDMRSALGDLQRKASSASSTEEGRWQLPPTLPSAPSPHASRANSGVISDSDALHGALTGEGTKSSQEARVPGSSPANANIGNASKFKMGSDPLLQSLSRGAEKPKAIICGDDDLLAGLEASRTRRDEVKASHASGISPTEESKRSSDDWGAFLEAEEGRHEKTAASTVNNESPRATRGGGLRRGSADTPNLLDL